MTADHLSAPADLAETDGVHAWSPPRRRVRLRLGALAAVAAIVTVAAAVAVPLWAVDGVQRTVCERVLARAPVAPAVAVTPCAPPYRPIGEAGAQTAVDRFFERRFGRPTIWADTSAPVKAAGFNTYTVDVRDYRAGGSRSRRWRVRIGHTANGGPQVLDAAVVARLAAPSRQIRHVVSRSPSGLWQRPRSNAAVSRPGRAHEVRAGGTLRAMCQVHHGGRMGRPLTDPDWWTRTSLGWIPNQALDADGRDTRRPGLGACDPHWAAR
jgi:hypothetical protein